ncbi:TonB family protein [Allisonella histaminiformans]|uniref:TonB family protein n=1 Tax=Allisonella histaminiformans TaxID=209880 RepID=UPI002E7651AB|nr:TonB family protein [Allisonella histaminiformans]
MRGERRRKIAALGAAIGIHLVAATLGGWLLLEHEEQLPPGVVEVAVLGDSGSESGAASGKTGDTVGAGSNFRDMGQNAGAAVTESAGKASPADSTSWRGDAEKALPEHPVSGEAGASGSSAAPGRTAASPSAGHMGSGGHGGAGGRKGPGSDRGGGHGGSSGGMGSNFRKNGDGSYTAMSSEGISYRILRDARAEYPDEARDMGYDKPIAVTADILVGLSGKVELVKVLSSAPNLGFREEALRACRQMKFAPIYYNGKNIKMHFKKTIHFIP